MRPLPKHLHLPAASLALLLACSPPLAVTTVEFEPTEVVLRGELVHREWWGAPNFGEDRLTDSKDRGIALILSKPIDVRGRLDDPMNQRSVLDVSEIQLIGSAVPSFDEVLPTTPVVVRGRLFTAQSGQHHTRVVMQVLEIAELETKS